MLILILVPVLRIPTNDVRTLGLNNLVSKIERKIFSSEVTDSVKDDGHSLFTRNTKNLFLVLISYTVHIYKLLYKCYSPSTSQCKKMIN